MTEINRYRDGELSSTALAQRIMEESHSVEKGEGKKLDWHGDHESWDGGLKAEHEAPGESVGEGAYEVAKKPKLAYGAVKLLAGSPAGLAGTLMFATGAVATAEVLHALLKGDELKHLSDLDAMDVGTTGMLDLDPGFKKADTAKHPGIVPQKFFDYMNTNPAAKEIKAELQASADAGMRAALDALRCGGPDQYKKVFPDFEKRLDSDIAFNKGFQSVIWGAAQHDGEERLRAIKEKLDQSDARSEQSAHVVHG